MINNQNKNENLQSTEIQQHEAANDFEFLQEKIKERPINKKKLLRRTIITASMAVLFGLLACLSFLLLEPVLNNWLYPEEEPEIVTFPQEQNEMLPEDMLTEGTTVNQSEEETKQQPENDDTPPSTENDTNQHDEPERSSSHSSKEEESTQETTFLDPSKDVSHTELETDVSTENTDTDSIEALKPYQTQFEELYKVYREVASSMVTVTAVHSDVDWFNNPYQSEGTTAGVIIANNNRELLILSKKSPLDNAQTIRIRFCNGFSADASIKKYEKNTDLAVLAVDLKYITNATLGCVSVASLGSSASSRITGTPVIAVGNIFGYQDSVCYGMLTSSGNNIYMADNVYQLITTDIYASENPSGILVNMDKEIIGIIDNSHNNSDTKNLLSAIGITELKGVITKLSNGEDIPYLGIYAQDISAQTRNDLGLPQGAYIFNIDMDSPAMKNGIQKGDILVQVGAQEIKNASDYMEALRNTSPERGVRIIVRRANVDEYEEMRFMIQAEILE